MEPRRTRLLEFATLAITFLKEKGLLEEFLDEKYLELRPREYEYFGLNNNDLDPTEEDYPFE